MTGELLHLAAVPLIVGKHLVNIINECE